MKVVLSILIVLILFSCSEESTQIKSIDGYLSYLNNPDNGLTKTKKANGISISVKYMPAEYLVYKDYKGRQLDDKTKDSLINEYNKTQTYLMVIGPDTTLRKDDIMYRDLSGINDYKQRIYNLSFEIENLITLNASDKKYSPVLSSFEDAFGLKQSRSILFVFAPKDKDDNSFEKAEKFDFVFDDEYFGTGINHFVFVRDKIKNIPKINFWNN